ncbi:MAG: DUF3048 domain-containing protein [Actinobacteria bacterium]|nr:DUF3048 domain-containing protein [Actinomycetota bacterium]
MKSKTTIKGRAASQSFKPAVIFSSLFMICLILISGLCGCKPGQTDISAAETAATASETTAAAAETTSEAAETATAETTSEETAEETTVQEAEDKISENINKFSGLELTAGINNYRPIAIMVQNNPKARPHSGLIYADIVFELVAEGGVTRFVTVYSSYDPEIIGPVRSARIYFAEIARSLDPIYTFWGSYPQAYDAIKNMDMDVLDANSTAYVNYTSAGWREPTRNTALEHTAFINTAGIRKDAQKYGYSLEGGQSPLQFKLDAPEQERGNIDEITVDFSSESYVAGFSYDKESNKYMKSLAGQPHSDFETGQQIALNNVIVMLTDIDGPIDQYGHMQVRTTGTSQQGEAYFFMDGNVVEGTWERASLSDPFVYKDLDGNQMLFNRGSTWICIIQSINRLTY